MAFLAGKGEHASPEVLDVYVARQLASQLVCTRMYVRMHVKMEMIKVIYMEEVTLARHPKKTSTANAQT